MPPGTFHALIRETFMRIWSRWNAGTGIDKWPRHWSPYRALIQIGSPFTFNGPETIAPSTG